MASMGVFLFSVNTYTKLLVLVFSSAAKTTQVRSEGHMCAWQPKIFSCLYSNVCIRTSVTVHRMCNIFSVHEQITVHLCIICVSFFNCICICLGAHALARYTFVCLSVCLCVCV